MFKKFTIAFLSVLCALALCPVCAFAAETGNSTESSSTEGKTFYPDNFEKELTFEDGGITDYAICGDTYAFAYSGKLAVLYKSDSGERQADIYTLSYISGLDFTDEGKLLVAFTTNEYCTYPDLETKTSLDGVEIQTPEAQLVVDKTTYYISNTDNSLTHVTNGNVVNVATEDGTNTGFAKLKEYDGNVYAVLNNCLYKIEGSLAVKIEPIYFNYEATANISVGDSLEKLKSEDYEIKTAWITQGSYYTRIDLEASTGNYFALPEGMEVEECTVAAEDKLSCLVLAESGNASIVCLALDGNCYLTRTEKLTDVTKITSLTNSWSTAAYALDNIGVYASPYSCSATKIATLECGEQNAVTVLGQYTDLTGVVYSRITYSHNGDTVVGYVVDGLLTPYSFANEENETHKASDVFSYSTSVTTVVLVIVIVLLIIIAILYISVISSKRFRENKEKKRKDDDDDDEE